jgi:hypothetical protein
MPAATDVAEQDVPGGEERVAGGDPHRRRAVGDLLVDVLFDRGGALHRAVGAEARDLDARPRLEGVEVRRVPADQGVAVTLDRDPDGSLVEVVVAVVERDLAAVGVAGGGEPPGEDAALGVDLADAPPGDQEAAVGSGAEVGPVLVAGDEDVDLELVAEGLELVDDGEKPRIAGD